MSEKISFSESTSLALEAVCALLAGNLAQWVLFRRNRGTCWTENDYAYNYVSEPEGRERFYPGGPKTYLGVVNTFSRSLRKLNLQITKMELGLVKTEENRTEIREFDFHLGEKKKPSLVVLRVRVYKARKDKDGYPDYAGPWKQWNLSNKRAIVCSRFPNANFPPELVLLGREVKTSGGWQ